MRQRTAGVGRDKVPHRHSRVGRAAGAALSVAVLAACAAQPHPSGQTGVGHPSAAGRTPIASATSVPASPTIAPHVFTVGQTLTGGEFAADLMDSIGSRSVRVTTAAEGRRVSCVVTAAATGTFVMPDPAAGIHEMRVLRDIAYVEDRPGTSQPWLEVDLPSERHPVPTVPTQAIADALNRIDDVIAGDCRWNERLAAVDPTGLVKVTGATADGWALSVPTDPESQGAKDSASPRSYPMGNWQITKNGLPISYRASTSSRVTTWSEWSDQRISPPPAGQIRH
jgi:hypothetical protein